MSNIIPIIAEKPKRGVLVTLIQGVEGPAIYINNHRIAGPKPWGGGKIVKEWKASAVEIQKAMKSKP